VTEPPRRARKRCQSMSTTRDATVMTLSTVVNSRASIPPNTLLPLSVNSPAKGTKRLGGRAGRSLYLVKMRGIGDEETGGPQLRPIFDTNRRENGTTDAKAGRRKACAGGLGPPNSGCTHPAAFGSLFLLNALRGRLPLPPAPVSRESKRLQSVRPMRNDRRQARQGWGYHGRGGLVSRCKAH
jgi:hypothetical protein